MIENAIVTSSFLGREDHGILTFYLTLKGKGWGVSVGGYALDEYSQELKVRVPVQKGFQAIAEILKVIGVDSWEKIPGTSIRCETTGLGGTVFKIGNLIEDNWIDFKSFFATCD
ncbi:hypothetical protein ACWN8P_12630 [Vagococcus salmoninarum]|uniref:Uncharacterized protein n=1 Tax=Vagococcus salmoninarum TaxID=2739 RepID=A0A429ZSH9_9ENTE|nr:hypothetical protein [Vagococcus salmoninarum]RST96637.1 hypothetical protein CBF35_05235 [Vagococcus salmoninarum]